MQPVILSPSAPPLGRRGLGVSPFGREIGEPKAVALVDHALAWALDQPGIASMLAGGRVPDDLEHAVTALALDEPALFAQLATA